MTRGAQLQLSGEVDPPQPLAVGAREEQQRLVIVDGQAVIGLELGAERPASDRVAAQKADPRVYGRIDTGIIRAGCLIRQ